ncbi:unnamed protein product [Linum tenue]|uniref:Serine/threonine-protein phosphatase 4 regulatory subunit 2 n=1 Tax=Linum tenue TaxID=586396 RepID=A0AAV0PZ98_9ROSI|nr:unnamed protein product [Linum tenue]
MMPPTAEPSPDHASTSSGDKDSDPVLDNSSPAPIPAPEVSSHREEEPGPETPPNKEGGDVLELIASTGKFWHNWDDLKIMLSSKLKQVWGGMQTCFHDVLSEYPEVKMTGEEQKASLGETYPELMKRLDDALLSFDEGPPFTLQRLCEILLTAKSIYPNLSKLALALEKNLLVTSTLTACTDPHPLATQNQDETDKATPIQQQPSHSEQNGVQHPTAADGDEIMADVETDIGDEMTIDMEPLEEMK